MLNSSLLQLAARQSGVISRHQLQDADVSNAQLSRARGRGTIVDVTARTVRVASSPDTFLSRCTAVSLHLESQGFLSGVTAGRLHGLREMPHRIIHATIPAGHRVHLPRWAHARSSNWFDIERDAQRLAPSITVAEPHRLLFDLAAVLDDRAFRRAAEDCWHRGLVSPTTAAEYLRVHRRRGKNGTTRMHRWLDHALLHDRPAESGLELDLIEAIQAAGLPEPVRQHSLTLPNGQRIRVDLAWPEIRLCVEPGHSWWHGGDDGVRRDNERKLGALAIGWETIQLDESLRADPQQAGRLIAAAHRHRSRLIATPSNPHDQAS